MTHHLHRRIRHLGQRNLCEQFSIKSLSRPDVTHEMEVDLESGLVHCSCEVFRHQYYRHEPKLKDVHYHCEHIRRAISWAARHNILLSSPAVLRPCCVCGVAEAQHDHANDDGTPSGKFICVDCVGIGAIRRMHGNDCPSDFLASHGPTATEKQAESEYFANERKRDAFADYMESQSLIQIEDMGEEMDLEEPEYVDNDARCGLRRERVA